MTDNPDPAIIRQNIRHLVLIATDQKLDLDQHGTPEQQDQVYAFLIKAFDIYTMRGQDFLNAICNSLESLFEAMGEGKKQ